MRVLNKFFIFTTSLILIGSDTYFANFESTEHVGVEEEDPELWSSDEFEDWEPNLNVSEDGFKEEEKANFTMEMSQEERDSILYDLYDKQPEIIEEYDEDGLQLSDTWTILDSDDREENVDYNSQVAFTNEDDIVKAEIIDDSVESTVDYLHQSENMVCDETREKINKRTKVSGKERKEDEFYFKHKAYGKNKSQKGRKKVKAPNWKQNCCIRGKRVGNSRRTFLAHSIFQECKDRTRSLASRMSRSCKWIFWSCCEARALRKYYIHHQSQRKKNC